MGKTESFEFLNDLALAFRRGEKHARPQYTPVLEGVRAVLAHLDSAGRLLADDEMPLTAEQLEDVRTMLWSPGVTALEAFRRLRALFPATEPAEEFKPSQSIDEAVARVWKAFPPTPAEPAEEETKAEVWDAGFEAGYDHAGCEHTPSGISIDPPLNPYDERNARPAASPVVPAPTEPGPWQTLQEVPEGVTRVLDSECELWVQEGGQWFSICQLHNPAEYAPFVAAEEG